MARDSAAGPKPTHTTSCGLSAVLVVEAAAVALEFELAVDMASRGVESELERGEYFREEKKIGIENLYPVSNFASA